MSPQTVPRLCQPWIPQARLTQLWRELISAGCKRLTRIIHELRLDRHNSFLKRSLRLSCLEYRVLKPEAPAKDCADFLRLRFRLE